MKKIQSKIAISIASIIILLIAILLIFFNSFTKDIYINIIKRDMNDKIGLIDIIINESPGLYTGQINPRFSDRIKHISSAINLRITVVDFSGKVIADADHDPATMDNHRYRNEIKDALRKKSGDSIRHSDTLNVEMLYYAKKTDHYILRLAEPLNEIDDALKRFQKSIFLAGIIIIISAVVIIIFISGRITNPIRETTNFAVDFSQGDYSKRILNFSDDEIGVLQKSLNRMADSIVSEMQLLITEQNKLKVTFESISDGIALVDKNRIIVIANKAFLSLMDINTYALNKIYYEVIRGSELNKKIEKSLISGEAVFFQEKLLTNKFCEIFLTPIKEDKTTQGILIIIHDITEKKRMEALKTALVGNLSHELKTPIAIQKGYLETMQLNLGDTTLCTDFLAKALLNLERQNAIINDMLKLNMLETMTGIEFEKIDLREIILNCVEILNSKAKTKEIDLELDIEMLDKPINGNKFLAEEIFFNIIINAINYNNPRGKISIAAKADAGRQVISIADTGIGIPEDSLDRIFERFYRVDKSRSRATGGTGLGLSIVKHAAEILGWQIDVQSGAGGTTFYIRIV